MFFRTEFEPEVLKRIDRNRKAFVKSIRAQGFEYGGYYRAVSTATYYGTVKGQSWKVLPTRAYFYQDCEQLQEVSFFEPVEG